MLKNIRIERIISAPTWAKNFFWRFQLYYMLDIVPSCNLVQCQGKLMMQTAISIPQIWTLKFFLWALPLLIIRHCSKLSSNKFKENQWIKLEKMASKPLILDLNLVSLVKIWASKISFASFTSTNSCTLFLAMIICDLKEN